MNYSIELNISKIRVRGRDNLKESAFCVPIYNVQVYHRLKKTNVPRRVSKFLFYSRIKVYSKNLFIK